jgi:hypothetical protein
MILHVTFNLQQSLKYYFKIYLEFNNGDGNYTVVFWATKLCSIEAAAHVSKVHTVFIFRAPHNLTSGVFLRNYGNQWPHSRASNPEDHMINTNAKILIHFKWLVSHLRKLNILFSTYLERNYEITYLLSKSYLSIRKWRCERILMKLYIANSLFWSMERPFILKVQHDCSLYFIKYWPNWKLFQIITKCNETNNLCLICSFSAIIRTVKSDIKCICTYQFYMVKLVIVIGHENKLREIWKKHTLKCLSLFRSLRTFPSLLNKSMIELRLRK